MKRIGLFLVLVGVFVAGVAGQAAEKFDILSFTTPKGWQKEIGKDAVALGTEDAAKDTQCLITVFKSVAAGDDAKANFDASWVSLVAGLVQNLGQAQRASAVTEDGWALETGAAAYDSDGRKGIAMLVSATGNGSVVNVLILTNSDTYEPVISDFIASIKLPKVAAKPAAAAPAQPASDSARLIGKWQRSGSGAIPTYGDPVSWGTSGYTKSRYELRADGTYVFTERSFRMMMQDIIIAKENGTYTVNGNSLTLKPAKSTIASYRKAGGGDKVGALVKSQNRELETVTYQFTFHFFSGIQEWNLVLQAERPTKRDGAFSNNTTFSNAWYYDQKYIDEDLTK